MTTGEKKKNGQEVVTNSTQEERITDTEEKMDELAKNNFKRHWGNTNAEGGKMSGIDDKGSSLRMDELSKKDMDARVARMGQVMTEPAELLKKHDKNVKEYGVGTGKIWLMKLQKIPYEKTIGLLTTFEASTGNRVIMWCRNYVKIDDGGQVVRNANNDVFAIIDRPGAEVVECSEGVYNFKVTDMEGEYGMDSALVDVRREWSARDEQFIDVVYMAGLSPRIGGAALNAQYQRAILSMLEEKQEKKKCVLRFARIRWSSGSTAEERTVVLQAVKGKEREVLDLMMETCEDIGVEKVWKHETPTFIFSVSTNCDLMVAVSNTKANPSQELRNQATKWAMMYQVEHGTGDTMHFIGVADIQAKLKSKGLDVTVTDSYALRLRMLKKDNRKVWQGSVVVATKNCLKVLLENSSVLSDMWQLEDKVGFTAWKKRTGNGTRLRYNHKKGGVDSSESSGDESTFSQTTENKLVEFLCQGGMDWPTLKETLNGDNGLVARKKRTDLNRREWMGIRGGRGGRGAGLASKRGGGKGVASQVPHTGSNDTHKVTLGYGSEESKVIYNKLDGMERCLKKLTTAVHERGVGQMDVDDNELDTDVENAQEVANGIRKDLELIEKEKQQKEEEKKRQQEEKSALMNQLTATKDELKVSEDRVSKLEESLEKIKREKKDEASAESDGPIACEQEETERLENARAEVHQYLCEIADLKGEIVAKTSEYEKAMEAKEKEHEDATKSLQIQCSNQKTEIASLKKENEQRRKENSDLEEVVSILRVDMDEKNKGMDEMKASIEMLKASIEMMKQSSDNIGKAKLGDSHSEEGQTDPFTTPWKQAENKKSKNRSPPSTEPEPKKTAHSDSQAVMMIDMTSPKRSSGDESNSGVISLMDDQCEQKEKGGSARVQERGNTSTPFRDFFYGPKSAS